METSLKRVLEDLKKGKIHPIYLISGDEFLAKDALHKIVESTLPPEVRDLNLFLVDGEERGPGGIGEAILTPPLIGDSKIVVVRNAEFLSASTPLPQAAARIVNLLGSDPPKAARQFLIFLKKTGWILDDLRNGGWKQIPDSEWKKVMGSDELEQREKWLPRIIELCDQYGLTLDERDGVSDIEEILQKGIPEGNSLILTATSVDKRRNIYKKLAEVGVVLDFSLDRADKKESRIMDIAGEFSAEILRRSGKEMSRGAMEALGRKTGLDLQKMAGELEKLAAFSGDKRAIDAADVESIVNDRPEDSVFSLTGAISERNSSKALLVLKDLLDQGLHPLMIFTMIAREARLLLFAKMLLATERIKNFQPGMEYPQFQRAVYPDIKDWVKSGKLRGDLTGSHPYALFHSLRNSFRFTRGECLDFLERLLDTDVALKTTGQDPKMLLKMLLISMCEGPVTAEKPGQVRRRPL